MKYVPNNLAMQSYAATSKLQHCLLGKSSPYEVLAQDCTQNPLLRKCFSFWDLATHFQNKGSG